MSGEPRSRRRERSGRSRRYVFLIILDCLYVLALATVGIGNARGPELSSWLTLNLYAPQWVWAVPGVILALSTAILAWKWTWLPMAGALWVFGPLMGLAWQWKAPVVPAGSVRVRVMTWNIDSHLQTPAVAQQILAAEPDIILLQEANAVPIHGDIAAALDGFHCLGPVGGLLVASRFPLVQKEDRRIPLVSEAEHYLYAAVRIGGRNVHLYDLHLPTPRTGLQPLLAGGEQGKDAWRTDINSRLWHAAMVARDLGRDTEPRIVAGDLNSPPPSMVLRTIRQGGLRDAFAEGGRGYGYTYGHQLEFRHSYVRIDHILLSRDWVTASCRAGDKDGSDHRPVIADLYLRPQRQCVGGSARRPDRDGRRDGARAAETGRTAGALRRVAAWCRTT